MNLEGFSEVEITADPQPSGNNAAWILSHILAERDTVLELLGGGKVMTEAERKPFLHFQISTAKALLPSKARLFEIWDESQARISAALDKQTPETLDEVVPAVMEGGKPDSRGRKIVFFHFHESYHIGQLGLLRRLLGKEGAI